MEKIEWQSFKTLFYLEHYKKELSDIKDIDTFSDWQIEHILIDRKLEILPKDTSHTEKIESTDEWWDFLSSFDKYWNSKFWPHAWWDINTFVKAMKDAWLYHNDYHAWNFMQDKEWNIYMIDFWRVTIPWKQTKSNLFKNF